MVVQGEKRWTWDWGRVEERCLGVEVGRVALAVRERPRCERSHQALDLRQKYVTCLLTSDKGPGRRTGLG